MFEYARPNAIYMRPTLSESERGVDTGEILEQKIVSDVSTYTQWSLTTATAAAFVAICYDSIRRDDQL